MLKVIDPNLSMSETCGNCRFYRFMKLHNGELVKVCKLHPPKITAVLIPTPKGPEWQINGSRPQMDEGDWCGDWQASKH